MRHGRMRGLALGLAALSAATIAGGAAPSAHGATPHATARPAAAAVATCRRGYYANVSGTCVKSPGSDPAGATARCRDATYSYSLHASGTCSHHGGVARWIHHP